MKGDFTRLTFRPERHYSGVRLQQGRVSLDADFNEQVDIAAYRGRVTARDPTGPAGAPDDAAGFAITGGGTLTISAGRMYVDGIHAVNEAAVAYTAQLAQVGPLEGGGPFLFRPEAPQRGSGLALIVRGEVKPVFELDFQRLARLLESAFRCAGAPPDGRSSPTEPAIVLRGVRVVALVRRLHEEAADAGQDLVGVPPVRRTGLSFRGLGSI